MNEFTIKIRLVHRRDHTHTEVNACKLCKAKALFCWHHAWGAPSAKGFRLWTTLKALSALSVKITRTPHELFLSILAWVQHQCTLQRRSA
jgi:hypothetical protein